MFAPGENYLYDIFIAIVRVWWNIIKVVVVAIVYFARQRPPALNNVNHAQFVDGIQSNQAPPAPSTPMISNRFLPRLLVAMGLSLVVIGFSASTAPIWLLLLGVAMVLLGVFIYRQMPTITTVEVTTPKLEQADAAAIPPQAQTEIAAVVYTLRFSRQTAWHAETALHFVRQLVVTFPQLLLTISADHQGVVWQLVDAVYGIEPSVLEQLVRTSYPDAEITVEGFQSPQVETPFFRYLSAYRQMNFFVAPIAYVDSFKSFDPLNALSQAMNGLQPGERVTYLLGLAGHAQDAYQPGQRLITQSTIHPLQFLARGGVEDAAAKLLTGRDRMDKYEYRDQKVLEDKLREVLCYAYLWIQIDAPDKARLAQILALMDTQLEHFTHDPFNGLAWVERALETYTETIDSAARERETHLLTRYRQRQPPAFAKNGSAPACLILEPREVAALWHPPAEGFSASRIGWASGLSEVPEAVAHLSEGALLGVGKYQGQEVAVRLPQADRVTHVNVVGRTGVGKSTLLHSLIAQDIARGAGVAVIDPHGKLVSDLLRSSIPPEREADVVLLDIANQEYPPPLNPLSSAQGYAGTLKMVGVIERLFAGTESSARMASYLRAALIPLQSESQATMRDVTRMFMDSVYREARLSAIDDPETLDFWDYHFNTSGEAMQQQIAEPIINRIRPFYANPTLYPILCHPDHLDFRALMQQKKILLISLALDEERVPEQERNLIGALLMSQLQIASMKAQFAEPFHLYVDEVQRFVTTSLSEMLSEARKYGLALTTANQYLGQLTGKTLEAVMGNVGTSVIFRCSPDDARDLAAYTKPRFDAQTLMDLDRFQAVVKLQVQGQTQTAFNLMTLPPPETPEDAANREQRIRQQSRDRYTPKRKTEVLDWLKERYPRRRVPTSAKDTQVEDVNFYDPQ